jgi:hypothetical protein
VDLTRAVDPLAPSPLVRLAAGPGSTVCPSVSVVEGTLGKAFTGVMPYGRTADGAGQCHDNAIKVTFTGVKVRALDIRFVARAVQDSGLDPRSLPVVLTIGTGYDSRSAAVAELTPSVLSYSDPTGRGFDSVIVSGAPPGHGIAVLLTHISFTPLSAVS